MEYNPSTALRADGAGMVILICYWVLRAVAALSSFDSVEVARTAVTV